MAKIQVEVAGIKLKNPVIAASGTIGSGREYSSLIDFEKMGAIIPKSITYDARKGNPLPRICETSSGMLNSIGLENEGVSSFVQEELPVIRDLKVPIVVSVAGETIEEYVSVISLLNQHKGIKAIELNASCPNVDRGGIQFGCSPGASYELTSAAKGISKYPVIVKLTPNVGDIKQVARSVEEAGADALSLINTVFGMAIDINTKKPKLGRSYGGLSGPAIKPIAVRMVYEVANTVKIPVIGMGGIMSWEDAIEFMMAGATAVQVGTANFVDPNAMIGIIDGISGFLDRNGYDDVREIIGEVRHNEH